MDSNIRVGNVTAVDEDNMKARVKFPDTGIVSDWLTIMRHKSRIESTESSDGHTHEVKLKHALPEVGDSVICIYGEGFNSDGYILGGLSG